jgi:MSHA biogenesis protein MshQ
VAGTQKNLPVLVGLASDGDLASKAKDNGFDLAFTSSDGKTELPHEIEKFNGQTGELVAWVRVPLVSSSADTVLYLYYGNPDLTSSTENPQGVWDSGFAGVWHLGESGNGTPGEYEDSGQYGNHGQGGEGNSLRVPARVAGRVGYGQDFNNADGLHDLIDVGSGASLDITGNQITIEAWIRHNLTLQWGSWYGFLNHKGWIDGYRLVFPDNSLNVAFQLPGQTHDLRSTGTVSAGEWHHVAATYDGATMRIFIDGLPDAASLAKSDNILSVPPPENEVWIGHGDQPADQPWAYAWEGQIDEVRISSAARSAGWIQTEYNNQSAPSSFYTLAGEQVYSTYCLP